MIFTSSLLAAKAAGIILASTSVSCKVTEAPNVSVKVVTDEIKYDASRSTKALSNYKSDSKSPFPPGADTATGGLRVDQPVILTQMSWKTVTFPSLRQSCMTYDTVDVTIKLSPHIYIAQEFNYSPCQEAVLEHERHHVRVDREVMNKYAALIGRDIQSTLDRVGALGPYNPNTTDAVKAQASSYIKAAVNRQEQAMEREMHARQQQVDSIEEYKRVGTYCKAVKIKR